MADLLQICRCVSGFCVEPAELTDGSYGKVNLISAQLGFCSGVHGVRCHDGNNFTEI